MDGYDIAMIVLAGWFLGSSYWCLVCAWVAVEKERNAYAWGVLGFVLWLGAFLPLAVAPDLTEYD